MVTGSVYKQVTDITRDYLGPATERFLDRQITFHLKKDPRRLTAEDIPKLAEWVKVSIAILTDDRSMVDDFSKRINRLAAK
jgi:pyridoxine 5'-phosphate synthase PdxJ